MYRLFVIIFTAAMTGLIFCLAAEELDTIGFEQGFQDIWVGRPEASGLTPPTPPRGSSARFSIPAAGLRRSPAESSCGAMKFIR